jgi:simple sugar transport system ATP-binding protein
VRYTVPREAVRDGIIYVTEDRKTEGFFETMSIAENLYSGLLAANLEKKAYISLSEMRALARERTGRLNPCFRVGSIVRWFGELCIYTQDNA